MKYMMVNDLVIYFHIRTKVLLTNFFHILVLLHKSFVAILSKRISLLLFFILFYFFTFFAQRSHKRRIKKYFMKKKTHLIITCSKSKEQYMSTVSTDLTHS